jgi:hypothetical protein
VGLAAQAMALQGLPGRQGDGAIDAEGVAIATDHNLGVAPTLEVFADGGLEFIPDSRSERLPHIEMSA